MGGEHKGSIGCYPQQLLGSQTMAMFERVYRHRLDADVARWQSEGIITPAVGDAIRSTLPPLGAGLNIPVVIAIAGGLLIAAAFLAFVASNWTEIPRVLRFAML